MLADEGRFTAAVGQTLEHLTVLESAVSEDPLMLFTTTGTDLVYNIVEELLTGLIDGVSINAYAGSGGRAGTKTKGAVNIFLANNPYATGVKKTGQRPGGPLPLARYTLKTHESKNKWIRLLPFSEDKELLGNRAGFAIHGRGK